MFQTALVPGLGDELDQRIQQQIQATMDELLGSGRWAAYHDPLLDELRQEIAAKLRVTHVRLCPSGSAAVELCLRACNLHPGAEVICSALDYPGNIRAIRVLDMQPVIVDVASDRFTISVEAIEQAATPQTCAVLVSHLYGDMAPVDELRKLCDKRDWWLIEDVCQMPGASLGNQMLGSFGHVAALSFGGNKPITCGAGGATVTSDRRIAARIDQYVDRPSDSLTISPVQAALLLPQWQYLAELTNRHRARLVSWLTCNEASLRSWLSPQRLTESDGLPVVYKLPIERTETGDDERTVSQPLGEIFRPQVKVLPGRGRVASTDNAVRMHQRYGLLDTRRLFSELAIHDTFD